MHRKPLTMARRVRIRQSACSLLSPAACRWNDAVHPQILDHLAVVIERVSWSKGSEEQTRGLPATTRGNRLDEVRAVQSGDCFVTKGERIFQVFDDVGLGFHVVRAFAVVDRVR